MPVRVSNIDVVAIYAIGDMTASVLLEPGANESTARGMDDEAESRTLMSIPSFKKFHFIWVEQEDALLLELKKALEEHRDEQECAKLVKKCYDHYTEAAHAKVRAAHEDASYIATGAWKTPFEAGMMWMGGWRPTTAIVLVFSLIGLQIENELQRLLEGINVSSMAALSAKQLAKSVLYSMFNAGTVVSH